MLKYHLYSADISPFAQRVVLQMEYKGIDFTQSHPPGGLGSPEYGLINPIQKLPVLTVDGVHLPESEIICEYIEEIHPEPSLVPEDPMLRARGRLIRRIADLYVMNPMMPLFKNFVRETRDQTVVDTALAYIGQGLTFLNNWLPAETYSIDNRLTLTDFAVAPILRYVAEFPPVFGMSAPFQGLDNVHGYINACRKDPHIERGLARIEAGWEAKRSGAH
ncbi:MAG: glutathione S-transferase family protein [Sphingomonadales bacterium]|jgi:glutathione S-transferase|nr:glutathione S-transferase family protein [Sphingomonadales bacterium]MBK9004015.1 glutathione S-transferase family protein [Sphingomonadales bacterium]MBK9269190.1 glutathione S-transferase family protein [Sphingomonadales bacterium]